MVQHTHMTPELWNEVQYFNEPEFDSPDVPNSGNNMRPRVVFALDAIRGLLGKRMRINSGYRSEARNKLVGGAPRSAHLLGNAVDVSTIGWTREDRRDFIIYARKLGFNGIGIAQTYIHVDMQPRMAAWIYRGAGQVAILLTDELKYA